MAKVSICLTLFKAALTISVVSFTSSHVALAEFTAVSIFLSIAVIKFSTSAALSQAESAICEALAALICAAEANSLAAVALLSAVLARFSARVASVLAV